MKPCKSCGFDNESRESNCLKCGRYLRTDPELGQPHRPFFVIGIISIMIGLVIGFSSAVSMLIGTFDKSVVRFLLPASFIVGILLVILGRFQQKE